jgi:hypothetical protein
MENALHKLLRNLRSLLKSYDKLARAVPDPTDAQRRADKALDDILSSLTDPAIVASIEKLMPIARNRILADPNAFQAELIARREELLQVEIKVCQQSGARRRDIDAIYSRISRKRIDADIADYISNIVILRAQLLKLHKAVSERVIASRNQPRVEKKRRKRNVAQGITSAIVGTAVIAADIPLPIVFTFSYALGASALHQAMRDIVGTRD